MRSGGRGEKASVMSDMLRLGTHLADDERSEANIAA
jgi:hypothetical protein